MKGRIEYIADKPRLRAASSLRLSSVPQEQAAFTKGA